MSDETPGTEDDERPPVAVRRITAQTLEEVVDEDLRHCDGCASEQLYGCPYSVRIGWWAVELCAECAAKLKTQTATVIR